MVGCSERDLSCRSIRLAHEMRERRRREKRSPITPERATLYKDRLLAAERLQGERRVRRVLFDCFESNANKPAELKNWIAEKLNVAADESKKKWNFDFEAGLPANIPGHRLEWQKTTGEDEDAIAPEGNGDSASVAGISGIAMVADENVNVSRAPANSLKTRFSSVKRYHRQALITDFLRPSKYAKTADKDRKMNESLNDMDDTMFPVNAE
ncbi:unnamed protein product [Nesidiocoris tenuis]|uniref:Cyclin-dependent kinase inhibitor domain-containing protein n=1 Tax=Nesidiocoris tenuis TaxID=355587 RepID=A0A6H5H238_9HEMI|nr:unnamed protein product [Nesidiocoris tenuis]